MSNVRGKKELIADCRLPAVIKPYNEGCSIGVHRVTNGDELVSALDEFFNTKEQALVEECLSGMELDSNTADTTNTLSLKIVGFSPKVDNEVGVANAKVQVRINLHALDYTTGA